MKKQLIAICLVAALLAAFAAPVFAATIDDVKAQLEALSDKYDNAKLSKALDDAQIWLADPVNAATVTDEVAAKVIAELKAAETTVGEAGSLNDLSAAQTKKVLDNATAAAAAVNLKLVIDAKQNTVTLVDSAGSTVTSIVTGNPIKQTGSVNWGAVLVVIVLSALAVFAVALYVPKRVTKVTE